MADGQRPVERAQPRASRRREKPQLSCTLCRKRKLRCDRGEPCGTCVRRGFAMSCAYVRSSTQGPLLTPQPASSNTTDRINQLEQLVNSLVESSQNTAATRSDRQSPVNAVLPPSSSPAIAPLQTIDDAGHIKFENNEAAYAPSTHWTVILDQIKQIKAMLNHENNHINPSASQAPTSAESHESDFFIGARQNISRKEIMDIIPPKSLVDKFIAGYFLDRPIIPVVLHGPTFLSEYERFWDDPSETPLIWIGLLFAVMCLVVSHRPQMVPMIPDRPGLAKAYREKVVQCLALGNYTRGQPYAIETLLLYLHIESLNEEEGQYTTSMILAAIVRLAYRMGYHRDPSHYLYISSFKGEMRRRIWALVVQLDIIMSAQLGVPRAIRYDQTDTAEPRNLLDEDLHPDMGELPPARPLAVQTEIQYTLFSSKLVSVYGLILDWNNTLVSRTNLSNIEVDLVQLEKQLEDAYNGLPDSLRMRSMAKSLVDSADTILRRISLYSHFQGAKCLLYYKFSSLLPSLQQDCQAENRHIVLRKTYIKAALEILHCQQMLYEETQLSDQLARDYWRVSSFTRDPCLMATAVLCSELDKAYDGSARPRAATPPTSSLNTAGDVVNTNTERYLDPRMHTAIEHALHNCCLVWTHLSNTSRDASKVAEAVRTVLNKMQSMDADISSSIEAESIEFTERDNFIPSEGIVAGSPSREFNAINQSAAYLSSSVQQESPDQPFSSSAHLSEYRGSLSTGQEAISSTQKPITPEHLDRLRRIHQYFPKKFSFPI